MPPSPKPPVAAAPPRRSQRENSAADKLVRRHLGTGPLPEQAQRLSELLAQTDAPSAEYEQWLECGARLYELLAEQAPTAEGARPELRPALIYFYLGRLEQARLALPRGCLFERAHLRLGKAEAAAAQRPTADASASPAQPAETVALLYGQAADELVQAKRPVLAALAYQAAGRLDAAQACFAQLLVACQGLPYQQALVRVNLSLSCAAAGATHRGEANRHAAAALLLLGELADEAEARGERERAVDCYLVLLQLGQALGRFENVAEGYLNCIRLLKEEQLPLHALRYYEDFARVGSELGEFHTVAQVCKEAAEYQSGLDPAVRRHYQRRSAQAAVAAAEQLQARGGAASLCEQAYLLAIESWNRLDDFAQVGACFAALAALPLPSGRQQRYAQLQARYPPPQPPSAEAPAAPLPAFLHKPQSYPPVWLLDLVEWEAAGDPAAVCWSLLGDPRRPGLTRRHALLALLLLHASPTADPPVQQRRSLALINSLANLRAYEALRPLERLYAEATPHPTATAAERNAALAVRSAILNALPKLPYKRALYLVLRGLAEPEAGLRRDALEALSRFHFADAIAPLCRLYREQAEPDVRRAVLHSLGRAHDLRAGEFLLAVLRQSPEPLRSEAQRQLLRYDQPELIPLVQRSIVQSTGPEKPALQAVLAHLLSNQPPAHTP